jgi:hypothetical protein
VPEASQASWPVRVMVPGLGPMPGLEPMPGLMTVPGRVSVPGLVTMTDLHDIQDALIIGLQHVNNSHPGATANHAQPGQAGP